MDAFSNPMFTITISIACAMATILALLIVYDIVQKAIIRMKSAKSKDDTNEDNNDKTSIDLKIIIYINLFLFLGLMVTSCVNVLFSNNKSQCQVITKVCISLYHIGRCNMYLVFIRRIQVVYYDTFFALKPIHTYIIYALVIIYSVYPFVNTFIAHNMIHISYEEVTGINMTTCTIEFLENSTYGFCGHATLDIAISCYLLYLFIFPLWRVIQHEPELSGKLYLVVIKYSILYISSILSVITLNILSYFIPIGYNYAIIDAFINGMVLIFLHPIHNKTYKRCCCLLHSCCKHLLSAPNDEIEDNPQDRKPRDADKKKKKKVKKNRRSIARILFTKSTAAPSTGNLTAPRHEAVPTQSHEHEVNIEMADRVCSDREQTAESSQRAAAYMGLETAGTTDSASCTPRIRAMSNGSETQTSRKSTRSQQTVSKLSVPSPSARSNQPPVGDIRSMIKSKWQERMSMSTECPCPPIPEEDDEINDVPNLEAGITTFDRSGSRAGGSIYTSDAEPSPSPRYRIPPQEIFEENLKVSDDEKYSDNDRETSLSPNGSLHPHSSGSQTPQPQPEHDIVHQMRLEIVRHSDREHVDGEDKMPTILEVEEDIVDSSPFKLQKILEMPKMLSFPSAISYKTSAETTSSMISNSLKFISYESTYL